MDMMIFPYSIPASAIKGLDRIALNRPVRDDKSIHSQGNAYNFQLTTLNKDCTEITTHCYMTIIHVRHLQIQLTPATRVKLEHRENFTRVRSYLTFIS